MNKKPHQHFIPRNYLNNFSRQEQDKFFISVKENIANSAIIEYSTKDICVKKNFYTIPNVDDEHKYLIENFYADNIDSIYPEVYKVLIDESISKINIELKTKIIATTLSLYFRTPKFINIHNGINNKVFEHFRHLSNIKGESINVDYLGTKIKIDEKNFKTIVTDIKKKDHITFLFQHLRLLNDFIKYKLKSGICVWHIIDDSEIITCDNPVIIRNTSGVLKNIYDSDNIILVPLDNKHILAIAPDIDNLHPNQIFRRFCNYTTTITTNIDIEKNCERWTLGTQTGLNKHISDKNKYNEFTTDNIQMINDIKNKALLLEDTFKKIQAIDGFNTGAALGYFEELKTNPLFKNDADIERLITKMNVKYSK